MTNQALFWEAPNEILYCFNYCLTSLRAVSLFVGGYPLETILIFIVASRRGNLRMSGDRETNAKSLSRIPVKDIASSY